MIKKTLAKFCLWILVATLPIDAAALTFITQRSQLYHHYYSPNVIMIASPGRSGSSLLTEAIEQSLNGRLIFKTHILPPHRNFMGKIIFIFSNPDRAAESVLHLFLNSDHFGSTHFSHVEGADCSWLKALGGTTKQNEMNNLLTYDALGCEKQLRQWLHKDTIPCSPDHAHVLAIKYENLWDSETQKALRTFLGAAIQLPEKKTRGYDKKTLDPREILWKAIYNVGTDRVHQYHAYDAARKIWQKAPPFQFLKLTRTSK